MLALSAILGPLPAFARSSQASIVVRPLEVRPTKPPPASARSSQASEASAPETCSGDAVRWLAKYRPAWFDADDIWKFDYFRLHVWCGAFARLGVMIVPMISGGQGIGMKGWLKVFRKTAKGWQKLSSIDSDDVDDIEADANGDILVNQNRFNGMLERWHWNGRQFVAAGKLWLFGYSNGGRFIEKTIAPGQDFGAPDSTCSFRQAMRALGKVSEFTEVKKLICHDFIGDGRTDMAIYVLDGPWYVFRSAGNGWQDVTPKVSPLDYVRDLNYRDLIPEGNDGFLLKDSLGYRFRPPIPPTVQFRWDGSKFVQTNR